MKRILTLVLVLVLALCCVTACKINEPDTELTPVSLTITSQKEVSIEVGQTYTLTYETDGAVNVTVSGGTYDKDAQQFSATEPGTYTITVTATAEGKKDTAATVTVTVTAPSANKTALIAAITSASALVKGDYTSDSWTALDTALKAANTARNQAGISQANVDSAAAALAKAIDDLQKNAIDKAQVADGDSSFTYNATTYKADDYYNFADIVAEIKTLNANTAIDLRSAYKTAIDAILAKLNAKVKLVIKSDLHNNTTMLVESLGTYTLTAESEDGATFAWTVNDEAKSTAATLEFTPAAFETEYVIKCTVTKGDNTNVKTLTVSFREVDYKVNNKYASGITVEDNAITVNQNCGWGDEEGKKVTLPDVRLSGNFSVYFDVNFNTHADVGVMAMFLLKENGDPNAFWVAVRQQDNKLEVATGGDLDHKPTKDMPVGTADLNKVIHVMMTRTITDGKAYLYAYLLDDAGNVIMEHKANGLYKEDADSIGTVQLGIQAENVHFVVSNIAVGIEDSVISKTALNKALAVSASYQEVDYTADSWAALVSAKEAASTASTQEAIVAATASVSKATTELALAPVEKVVVSEGNISFGGKTYLAANFENMADIIAEIETLNADTTITLNSVYAPKAQEIIAKLASKVTLSVAGAPENGVQYLVSTLPSFAMTATASEGATVAWSVNGTAVSSEAAYTFAPKAFGSYTITCVATQGEYSTEKEYKFAIVNAGWTSNKPGAAIDENNAIKVTVDYGWDDFKGKKVTTNDITLSGNFTIYFDLTFNNQNDPNVFALFFHKSNGDVNNDWVAITSQNNKLEVSCLEQKAYRDMSEGATAIGTKTSYIVTREIIDGRSYITATQVGANVVNDGTQDSGNRVSSDYTGPVVLGIQSEHAHFVVENIRVNSVAAINSKSALRALVKSAEGITKTDYVESVVTELNTKIDAANEVLGNVDATQAQIDAAFTALETAMAAIKPENYAEVTKAVVGDDTITYSITGITLNKADLYNFDTIAATINTLNSSDEYAANSAYTKALTDALASADYKISLSTIDFKGLESGKNYVTSDEAEYVIEVSSKTKDLTYAWTINDTSVEAEASYAFKPENGKTYTIKVVIQKTGEGYEAEKKEFLLENVTFMHSDVKTPIAEVTIGNDGSFSSATGIGWGHWEGRKVLYDDLVFNGSFSITMDLTYNGTSGGATVATIHLLNADTLSPSFGGDWAFVGYGCICLHENPVRLETNWSGTGKKQSSDGGFEAVAAKMNAAASLLEQGDTFTVKLTCYRNASRQLQLVYALWDSTKEEWIEFNRNEWAGDMGGGFIVGINIENAAITGKNVRYELLAATDDYIAGSVKSRAALSAALVKYQDIVPSEYVNSAAFVSAYNAAWALMSNNSASADYDAAAAALVEAAEALVKRTVAVSVGLLDSGYTNYRGVDKFTATFADDVDATEIKWTYKLGGVEKTVEGADLALEVGAYTDVVLSFKVGEESYSYTYQDFSVAAIGLKSNSDKVTFNEDDSVKVDDGQGWGQKDQLVIENCKAHEIELVFNAKYDGTPGGGFQVMCINLFGEDIRPVFGYQREDRGNRAQLGFDSNGQWNDINNTEAEGEPYDYIFSQVTKFGIKVTHDAEGKFSITFTVYGADGSVISEKVCDYIRWYSSKTEIRFTFENIDLTLSDFEVYYN